MKILANDGISQSGIDKLEINGFEVITKNVPQDQLVEYINNNTIVCLLVRSATKVRKDIIDSCPSIKIIGRGGVGMDNIDVDYAREKGLSVINTPGASSQSVAELVMGHFFSLSRGLYDSNRQMPKRGNAEFKLLKKKYAKGAELRGKTLGIIGIGRIGKALASYAFGIGMRVVATDAFLKEAEVKLSIHGHADINLPVEMISMDQLLRESDYISLHVPMQTDGGAVISKKEFDIMKDGVILANASRGGVIDESDLQTAIAEGKVRAVALDVYDNEPRPDSALLSNEALSLSPHIGAATMEAQDRIGIELADQIMEILK